MRAGVTRMSTWLRPTHDSLTYLANFRQHQQRLSEVAQILADHQLRFGLEYVGPKTSWTGGRYPFVHTMAEAKELLAAIGQPNVGLVLDSWHWYTAHETRDDLLSLSNKDIVACDLNDAPQGVEIDAQVDSRRELPAATGVIDLKAFLSAWWKSVTMDRCARAVQSRPERAARCRSRRRHRRRPEEGFLLDRLTGCFPFSLWSFPSLSSFPHSVFHSTHDRNH